MVTMVMATMSLYVHVVAIKERTARLQWYKYLLGELPRVNYMALKKLTTHLCRVSEQQQENKRNLIPYQHRLHIWTRAHGEEGRGKGSLTT